MENDLKKKIFRNTITNYIVLFWTMFTGIFTTRILFLELGAEFYGFWTLIWMIFGLFIEFDY